jgi:uncharacterized BrkB/YihY/UPF0761 family membrane protein
VLARIDALQHRVQHIVDDLRRRSQLIDYVFTIIQPQRIMNDSLLSAFVGVRLLILLFPLGYFAVAGLGLGEAEPSRKGIIYTITSSIAQATDSQNSSRVIPFVIGLLVSAWTGRTFLHALRAASAMTWQLPPPRKKLLPIGGLFAATCTFAFLGSIVVIQRLRDNGIPWPITGVISLVLVTLVAWRVMNVLPHNAENQRYLLPGAVFFAVTNQALQLSVGLYFVPRLDNAEETYGALGGVLVLLTYLLLVGWLIVLALEFNARGHEWRRLRATEQFQRTD